MTLPLFRDESGAAIGGRKVIAVGGPKGGCGATFISLSLAVLYARSGRRVFILDAAVNRQSIHTLLSLKKSSPFNHSKMDDKTLSKSIGRRLKTTSVPNLYYVGVEFDPSESDSQRIISSILSHEPDILIIDLPSCSNSVLSKFHFSADAALLVATPGRIGASLIHGYLKNAMINSIAKEAKACDLDLRESKINRARNCGDIISLAKDVGADNDQFQHALFADKNLFITANQAKKRDDRYFASAISHIAKTFYGYNATPLDPISFDPSYYENGDSTLFLDRRSDSETAGCLTLLAKNLENAIADNGKEEKLPIRKPAANRNHYELLGIGLDAQLQQIQQAYLHLNYIYSPSTSAIFGSIDEDSRKNIIANVQEAYKTLLDPVRRNLYENTLNEDELSSLQSEHDSKKLETMGDLSSSLKMLENRRADNNDLNGSTPLIIGGDISGTHLKNIRVAKGRTLDEIAQITKVKKAYLQAIENDDKSSFPAPIFLKGFLKLYSKALGLDPDEISDKYLAKNL